MSHSQNVIQSDQNSNQTFQNYKISEKVAMQISPNINRVHQNAKNRGPQIKNSSQDLTNMDQNFAPEVPQVCTESVINNNLIFIEIGQAKFKVLIDSGASVSCVTSETIAKYNMMLQHNSTR